MDRKLHEETIKEIRGCRDALVKSGLTIYQVNAIERLIIAHNVLMRNPDSPE